MALELEAKVVEAAKKLDIPSLKPQQLDAVVKFMEGRDVFAALPTGFRKSLFFGLLPISFDLLLRRTSSIAVVVMPLTALMMEMKAKFIPKGVDAEFLGELQADTDAIRRVVKG